MMNEQNEMEVGEEDWGDEILCWVKVGGGWGVDGLLCRQRDPVEFPFSFSFFLLLS